jgi:hypothetical protein
MIEREDGEPIQPEDMRSMIMEFMQHAFAQGDPMVAGQYVGVLVNTLASSLVFLEAPDFEQIVTALRHRYAIERAAADLTKERMH